MDKRVVKNNGEEFTVALADDKRSATVTDAKGFTVTIRYASGERPFDTRTPNGWGSWESSMESAVNRAMALCVEARNFLTPEEFGQALEDYVSKSD